MKCLEIQPFFNILTLPSITLKRWNFPANLDFKGKIVAKFLSRSHFVSIYKNMTIKQQTNHGTILIVCHLHSSIYKLHFSFHSLVSYFVNFILSPPLCESLKVTNYGMSEKKIFCIYGYFSISPYIKVSRKLHL